MADIGQTLREARMRSRIDITEVESRTKIRAKYLRALENEEWDLLPGPVYVKSFLRTYGDYLGLDSRLLIDEYRRRYEHPSDSEPRPVASLGGERDRHRGGRGPRGPLVPSWAVIGVILVGVIVALYVIGSHNGGPAHPRPASARASGGNRQRHHGTTVARTTTTTRKAAPSAATLQIVPTGTVYVCVESDNGRHLVAGTYSAGETIPLERRRRLLVTLGDSDARVLADGKPYPITPSASPIGFQVTATGVKPLSPGPTC